MNPNTIASYHKWANSYITEDLKSLPYHPKSDFPLDGDGGGDGYGNGYGDGETMGYGNKPIPKFSPQYFPAPQWPWPNNPFGTISNTNTTATYWG